MAMASGAVTPLKTTCVVVGGGPAGMMAGLLLARAGVAVTVLEKHADFLRDFRGDTVHPSTMQVLHELGLLERFLQRPHSRISRIGGSFGNETLELADFRSLKCQAPFIAMMPQWDFLDFLADEAREFPAFSLLMQTQATGLIETDGRVNGVRAQSPDGKVDIVADLVIGADGRHSILREAAGLYTTDIGVSIDVLWFRVSRDAASGDERLFRAAAGLALVTINRNEYWQCAYIVPKGGADEVREKGIEAFRRNVATAAPDLAGAVGEIASFDDVKLLTVKIDRLQKWWKSGLLMIGDAAHAMSPVGGVGINIAIQDAVAAVRMLRDKLKSGTLVDEDLAAVQKRRLWPVKATQFMQMMAQNRIVSPIIGGTAPRPPLPLRLVARSAFLKRRFAALIGIGARPEHVD